MMACKIIKPINNEFRIVKYVKNVTNGEINKKKGVNLFL